MDMSFANQALAAEYLLSDAGRVLDDQVHRIPLDIDRRIAELKLRGQAIEIDYLTEEQKRYLASWHLGT
jgi:adenosylhomocysteinase